MAIGELAVKYDGFVVTDEVYEHIVFDPYKHVYASGLPGMFNNTITCNSLSIEVNGAADANLTSVDILKKLKVQVNGAGDVDITGNAVDVSLEVNGAGDIDATGLKVSGEVKKHAAGLARISM